MTNILDTVEPDKTETWPETIYLQREGVSEAYEDETTWCSDKINSNDLEYRRVDVFERLLAEVASLKEELGKQKAYSQDMVATYHSLTQQLAAANGRVEMLRKALEHIESHTDSTNDGITYEICRAALSNLNEDSAG
jgi:primosomal protein N''